MSATGRGGERHDRDAYYTPQPLADAIVSALMRDGHIHRTDSVIEPSSGSGAFVSALRAAGCSVTGVDINAGEGPDICADFVSLDATRWKPDAVVGNPPFSLAEEHTRHALELVARQGGTVAFLLRLAFLESKARIAFWSEHPAAHVYVLSERPSFTGGGTDSAAYGVFVWAPHRGPTTLSHLLWRDEATRAGRARKTVAA